MSRRKDNKLVALPGGNLERFETFEECGIREVFEEVGLQIANPKVIKIENVVLKEIDHHYVVIFLAADNPAD